MSRTRESVSTVVLMAFVGVLLGLIGSVVSAARTPIGSFMLPWGAVLCTATVAVAVRAAVWSSRTRLPGAMLLAGWFVATGAVLLVSPGGDVLLPDIARTYWYLGSAFVLGLVALLWRLPEGHAELVAHPGDSDEAEQPSEDELSPAVVLPDEPSGEGSGVR